MRSMNISGRLKQKLMKINISKDNIFQETALQDILICRFMTQDRILLKGRKSFNVNMLNMQKMLQEIGCF